MKQINTVTPENNTINTTSRLDNAFISKSATLHNKFPVEKHVITLTSPTVTTLNENILETWAAKVIPSAGIVENTYLPTIKSKNIQILDANGIAVIIFCKQ